MPLVLEVVGVVVQEVPEEEKIVQVEENVPAIISMADYIRSVELQKKCHQLRPQSVEELVLGV